MTRILSLIHKIHIAVSFSLQLHFVDEMMNTFEFKEEVYVVAEDEKWFDSYELVKYTIVGAALGGAVGLFIAKKKKQKQNSENNLPIA